MGKARSEPAEYYFRSVPSNMANCTVVEVSKFQGGDAPAAVYRVTTYHSGRSNCDCPAGSNYRHCKHLDMVRKWKEQQIEDAQLDEEDDDNG